MIDYWLSINNYIPSQIIDSPIIINSLPSHDLDLISQVGSCGLSPWEFSMSPSPGFTWFVHDCPSKNWDFWGNPPILKQPQIENTWGETVEPNLLCHWFTPSKSQHGFSNALKPSDPQIQSIQSLGSLLWVSKLSLDWLMGKSTGNIVLNVFWPRNIRVCCRFSLKPMLGQSTLQELRRLHPVSKDLSAMAQSSFEMLEWCRSRFSMRSFASLWRSSSWETKGRETKGFTILFQELKSCNLGLCLRQFQFVPVDQLKATRKCLSLHNMFDTLI